MVDTYIPTDEGRWVSAEFERLAQVIQDYDPQFELRWIPPEHRRTEDKKPYCIFDLKIQKVVFFASELDSPVDILERLFRGDNAKHDVLANLERREAAQRALELRKSMDDYEDAADKANFLKNSPLHTLRFNGHKFDHLRRRID